MSVGIDLPEDVTNEELLKTIHDLNARKDINGILVQLPLPKHIDEEAILSSIEVEKDVDGLHPLNVAQLAKQGTRTGGVSITTASVLLNIFRLLSTMRENVVKSQSCGFVAGKASGLWLPCGMHPTRLH